MGDIQLRVIKIVAGQLGLSESNILLSSRFIDDLDADSLDTVELIMALEDEFDLQIPDEEAEEINNVQNALDYVRAHIKT